VRAECGRAKGGVALKQANQAARRRANHARIDALLDEIECLDFDLDWPEARTRP
jgi:hypothetical protein